MDIALIKNSLCTNTVVFETLEQAKSMLGHLYDNIVLCPADRGISHRFIDGVWYNPQPEKDASGIYSYVQDMCVLTGDLVYGLDGKIYQVNKDIDFQQLPPEDLPEYYVELSVD